MSKQHFAVPVWLCHESVNVHKQCVYKGLRSTLCAVFTLASCMIIVEDVACGAVELYCIAGVFLSFSLPSVI